MSTSASLNSAPSSPQQERRIAGSRQHPFKLAIIGGGPSGCSILVRAARIGMIPELCQFSSSDSSAVQALSSSSSKNNCGASSPTSPITRNHESPTSPQRKTVLVSPLSLDNAETSASSSSSTPQTCYAGICVVDAGPMERIGGGRLQDYIINSNTWINKFATNVIEEKLDNLPPETVSGTAFESLKHCSSTKQVIDAGNKTGPLKMVGHFLRDVGQRAVAAVQAFPSSSKFYVHTKVESIQRIVENGQFKCWKLVLVAIRNPLSSTGSSEEHSLPQDKMEIYALHVAMATGGHQTMPNFSNASYRQKTVLSDVVCTMEGVELLKSKIHRYLRTCANHGTAPSGRVVVIGGSHSAFSAAWVCLNLVNEDPTLRLLNNGGHNNNAVPANALLTASSSPISLNGQNQIKFGPSGVCILHRSAIRVFYPTRAEADHDHYPESSIVVNRITGNINPFGGIRGDAKELWRAIRSTREGRVRLLQVKHIPFASCQDHTNASSSTTSSGTTSSTNTANANGAAVIASSGSTSTALKQSIVEKMLDEAIVIVWAAGYATNMIPIYDHDGSPIQIRVSKGQAEVDEHANLLLSEAHHGQSALLGYQPSSTLPSYSSATQQQASDFQGIPVGNLYGSGLGYGLKATLDNGEPDGASGRADGVAVYLKRGATLILANVLGNKVYGGLNIHSWEERNQMLKKQQRQQEQQALALNMAQVLASADAAQQKSPAIISSSPAAGKQRSASSSFSSPVRVTTSHHSSHNNSSASTPGRSVTPGAHRTGPAPSTAIGLRSPNVKAQPQSTSITTPQHPHIPTASSSSRAKPASASRVRTNSNSSTDTSSTGQKSATRKSMDTLPQKPQQVALEHDKEKEKEKIALIRNVVSHVQQHSPQSPKSNSNLSHSANNNQVQTPGVTSLSEPTTPATTQHPNKPVLQSSGSAKGLGNTSRGVVTGSHALNTPPAAAVTSHSAASTPKSSHHNQQLSKILPKPSHGVSNNSNASSSNNNKNAAAQALRSSVDAAAAASGHSRSQKPMPGPLPLHMGSANIMLPPTHAPVSNKSPEGKNSPNRTLLSSSLK